MPRVLLSTSLLVLGCTQPVPVLVDVVTDYAPGREVAEIRTFRLDAAGEEREEITREVTDADDLLAGLRVAELGPVDPGSTPLRVELVAPDGQSLARRDVLAEVRAALAVTVLITRDCEDVSCDDPAAPECVAGTCVPLECAGGECLTPECAADAECDASMIACAPAVCAERRCLARPDDAMCSPRDYCDPEDGCRRDGTLPQLGPFEGTNRTHGEAIAFDGQDRIYLAGDVHGTVDFGGGPLQSAGDKDVLLVALESDGSHRWSRTFGDAADDNVDDIAVRGDRLVISGDFEGSIDLGGGQLTSAGFDDVFLATFTLDGEHVWSQRFGDDRPPTMWGGETGRAIAIADDGSVAMGGAFTGTIDFGGGPLTESGGYKGYLAMFAPDGSHRWSFAFGSRALNRINGVAFGDDGTLYVSGFYEGGPDFAGTVLPTATYQDPLVAAFDPDGTLRWVSTGIGGGVNDTLDGIAVDGTTIYIAGQINSAMFTWDGMTHSSAGERDALIAALDTADGSLRWSWTFGGASCETCTRINVDERGRLHVACRLGSPSVDIMGTTVTSNGSVDALVLGVAPDGTLLDAFSFGGPGRDMVYEVESRGARRYYTGNLDDTAGCGATNADTAGGYLDMVDALP